MVAFLVLETLMLGVFCALDLVLFYLFFEGGLIPMFLIIGIWGGKERIYAALQVLPLHLLRLGADAGRDDRDVHAGRHHRHPDADDLSSSRRSRCGCSGFTVVGGVQTLMFLAFFASLRGEDADVAGAHLAAGRARAGADRGLGDPGGDPAEDGRLRLPALLAADVPGGLGAAGRLRLHAVGDRHHLHQPRRDDAGGHEEADRLFVGRAHGLRHHGHLRAEPAGDRRRDLPDAQPRLHLRGAVPHRRA